MIEEDGVKRSWRRRRMRIGDFVEGVLKPFVEIADENLGTNLKECGGCKQRKEWLNNLTKDKEEE